jgi:endoglucanase
MQVLASQPTAQWFGDWNANVESDVHTLVTNAQSSNTMPVMVVYNIPQRDCGGFSAGGTNNAAGYTTWINAFAAGLGSAKAMVILEPDALSQISCLSAADQTTRLQLLSMAVSAIKKDANAKVYVDAGHSGWIDATTMAHALTSANISQADGFALNVSNFMATSNEVTFGQQVSALLNNKHFVVDTSRNGNGSNGQWCNPSGMAIGQKPTLQTGNALADGYLWLKTPGESDGTCSGGPSAGVWWPEYALQLVQNAHN